VAALTADPELNGRSLDIQYIMSLAQNVSTYFFYTAGYDNNGQVRADLDWTQREGTFISAGTVPGMAVESLQHDQPSVSSDSVPVLVHEQVLLHVPVGVFAPVLANSTCA
jgi:hypothetical protein